MFAAIFNLAFTVRQVRVVLLVSFAVRITINDQTGLNIKVSCGCEFLSGVMCAEDMG